MCGERRDWIFHYQSYGRSWTDHKRFDSEQSLFARNRAMLCYGKWNASHSTFSY